MNRLMLDHEDTAPRRTRYTVWKRAERLTDLLGASEPQLTGFVHHMNLCTLVAALQQAQRMTPRGYITTVGERP